MHFQTKVGTDIDEAVFWLKKGEVVGIPTETVYGLAANGLSADAVAKIYSIKNRPSFNPLILHVADENRLHDLIMQNEMAKTLIHSCMPGPLTLVLPRKSIVPDIVTAGLNTVGVRMPNHETTRTLLKKLDFPLAAPSANPSGYVSPTMAEHVAENLAGKIPYVLDGGTCTIGIESTIIGFENGQPVCYRHGGLAIEVLEKLIDQQIPLHIQADVLHSPGQMKSHYATNTPLFIIQNKEDIKQWKGKHIGCIVYDQFMSEIPHENQMLLSPDSDLHTAAKNLFQAMREMDARGFEIILAQKVQNTGIGYAINDRLQRAQHHLKNV
ncbi:MAG: L-threonylcarbamoyladenylate synthase [Sediminibacterium sp.]|nr:L-threonylcarbamoyladenylate synthase [Sediminibacterium sp.]